MKEKTILAQNIQTLRKEKGWTQEQLSQKLGCSFEAIRAYECCKREPACKVMVALEQVFRVTGAQLYGLEPLPRPAAAEPQSQPQETGPSIQPVPASYLIGMDGGSEDGDLPGLSIVCSECGQVIYSGVLAPGAGATVEIPQSCLRCSVTGGCGDE